MEFLSIFKIVLVLYLTIGIGLAILATYFGLTLNKSFGSKPIPFKTFEWWKQYFTMVVIIVFCWPVVLLKR